MKAILRELNKLKDFFPSMSIWSMEKKNVGKKMTRSETLRRAECVRLLGERAAHCFLARQEEKQGTKTNADPAFRPLQHRYI